MQTKATQSGAKLAFLLTSKSPIIQNSIYQPFMQISGIFSREFSGQVGIFSREFLG
jgi:hypothetical protein